MIAIRQVAVVHQQRCERERDAEQLRNLGDPSNGEGVGGCYDEERGYGDACGRLPCQPRGEYATQRGDERVESHVDDVVGCRAESEQQVLDVEE